MKRHQRSGHLLARTPWTRACLAGMAAVITTLGQAQEVPSSGPGQPAPGAPKAKDVVRDAGPGVAPSQRGRLVPANETNAPANGGRSHGGQQAGAGRTPAVYNTAIHDGATSAAVADLGLSLLRHGSRSSGQAQVNAVASPLSLSLALGMVHAGTSATGASELSGLLEPSTAAGRIFSRRLPAALGRMAPGAGGVPFVMANRVWVDDGVAPSLSPTFAALVSERFGADGAIVSFTNAEGSRSAINQWVSGHTGNRITELMPQGSVTPTTKVIVTNAIHFKSRWAEPFDLANSMPRPFHINPGSSKLVPTMSDERSVRRGVVDNIDVMELPFAGNDFSLMLAMPPNGHTLDALETDLAGLDIASWSSQLKTTTCRVELPRFAIRPRTTALKATLQALGVKSVFSERADFSAMLGKSANGLYLDEVYQSATVVIDEEGGEAAAATGATVQAKSFSMPAPKCAVDRPFLFAVMHRATGLPLFIGKVADPTAP